MLITVSEGDLSLGALTSSTSVELNAAGSILDAYADGLGRPVNISTATAAPGLGNVRLIAGASIGTLANPLDLTVAGELTSASGTSTTINHLGNLVARDMSTAAGDMTIVNSANMLGHSLVSVGGGIRITSPAALTLVSARATGGDIRIDNGGNFTATSVVAVDRNIIVNNGGDMIATSVFANLGNITINNAATLFVDKISAVNGAVTIVSGLSVIDINGDATSDIDAITISLTINNGSIGEPLDDLEINTADTASSWLFASASQDVYVTETNGRLNLNQVVSTNGGNIRLTTRESASAGENINALAGSLVSTIGGWLMLLSGDNLTLAGALVAKDIYVYGDHRNQDVSGSHIAISGTISADIVEVTTDVDDDVIVVAAAIAVGFVIRAGKGENEVASGAGNDQIYGGSGRDILRGGAGNDLLDAGGGMGNELYGEAGNDRIIGSSEGQDYPYFFVGPIQITDTIDGGDGDDEIWSMGGTNIVSGGAGNDLITGGWGSDRVNGGTGNDTIYSVGGLGNLVLGGDGDDILIGASVGDDRLLGENGNDRIYGQGGADYIDGGEGADYLDGGVGVDEVYGGSGDDELYGGGGQGDRLYGNDGDDVAYGSDDGGDFIYGGAGRDRLFGRRGNDQLEGGTSDDIMEGGDGDDLMSGDAGSDVLVGGSGHDILYGFNFNVSSDNSVDYLYGDFGTNENEVGSGNDQLYGGAGKDLLFGEGGDDLIDDDLAIAGVPLPQDSLDTIDYGTGEVGDPRNFVTPPATANPSLQTAPPDLFNAPANLPTGRTDLGRWGELTGSASGAGVSGGSAMASSPSMATTTVDSFIAWSDMRSGTRQVYVARHDTSGWQELGNSSSNNGVSHSVGEASAPSIAVIGGKPTVAWTERVDGVANIHVAQFDQATNSWIGLGNSLSTGGVSNTGAADTAQLIDSSAGAVVVWLERVGSTVQVYARLFTGTDWVELSSGSASGAGISNAAVGADVRELTIATGSGKIAVAWTQVDAATGVRQVYLKQYDGSIWQALAGSASGAGLSGQASTTFQAPITSSASPTLTYLGADLFVAWQTFVDQSSTLVLAKYSGATGSATISKLQDTRPRNASPRLVAANGKMSLFWLGSQAQIYAQKWNGISFVEELPGDASGQGVSTTGKAAQALSAAIDPLGRPAFVWSDLSSGRPAVMARTNVAPVTGNVYTASPAGNTIQQILDTQSLGAGDVIVVTGNVVGNVTISSSDAGVLIYGAEGSRITGSVSISADQVQLQRVAVTGNVSVTSAQQFSLRESSVSGTVTLSAGVQNQISYTTIGSGLVLTGSGIAPMIRNNVIQGSIAIDVGATSNVTLRDNQLNGATGLRLSASASGTIFGNKVTTTLMGLDIANSFTGLIRNNQFTGASVGLRYAASAQLSDNDIFGNATGVVNLVSASSDALGYVPGTLPNRIYNNATGVSLSGIMQGQRITNNTVGVAGAGSLVSVDLEHANVIEGNTTGVTLTGLIEFQRILRNTTGIAASSNQLIAHNILAGNAIGINVVGTNNTQIIANTFYSAGDNIRVTGSSSQTEIRNNILWTTAGYDIYVANDSTTGFFSDYNNLFASDTGKIGYWTKDFTDILDWQEDIYQFDLNSIGTTVVNPRQAEPRFFNIALDDYRVFPEVARQRFTSPTIDAGDLLTDLAVPASYTNLLSNPSFEADLSGWTALPSGSIKTSSPAPFDGSKYFFAGPNQTTTLEQTVAIPAQQIAGVDASLLTVTVGARARSASETPRDKGTLTVTFLSGAGSAIGQPLVINSANTADRWELIGSHAYLPAGTRSIKFSYSAVRQSGSNNDVYLDRAFVTLIPRTTVPDMGASSNSTIDVASPAHLKLISPDLYKDWEKDKPIDLRWDSYGNVSNSPVVIRLMQDTVQGPVLVTTISTGSPDNGVFTWIAGNSGVDFNTKGLRIQLSLASNQTVLDRSTETFTVPENTNTFFVNDKSTSGDEYSTAVGNNRSTGKVAEAPKPYPNNVLRIYSMGANQTLSVDTGTYPLLRPLVVSNVPGTLDDDEGFLFRGASQVGHVTTLRHANSLTQAPIVDLSFADFMTLQNLTLSNGTYGLYVRNTSTNFSASSVNVISNSIGGLLIDSGSTVLTLDRLLADQNNGEGIQISVPTASLRNSVASNNRGTGIYLINTGATTVESNHVFNNTGNGDYGIYVNNSAAGSPLVIGNSDLALSLGNRVHDNAPGGIYASGNVTVAGNTVYNQTSGYGVYVVSNATAQRNVVFDNAYGMYTSGGEVRENRIFHNTNAGIVVDGSPVIAQNTVYSNSVGVQAAFAFSGAVSSNILYANSTAGILLAQAGYYGGNPTIVNNTFVQPVGDGIRIYQSSVRVKVRNNIFSIGSGYALTIAPDSQTGFASDYNDFYLTGTGKVAQWQNVDRNTLIQWRTTAFTDTNSLSIDPTFVDVDGVDNVLGYVSRSADGRDDDFHLQSQHGSFKGIALAPVASGDGTGLPVFITNATNPSIDALSSPLIDRGDANDSFVAEPMPNGGFINIGAYGGTTQASLSPARYVTVLSPDGGEVWPQGQTFTIRWRSKYDDVSGGTFKIELFQPGNSNPVETIAASVADVGQFDWTIPSNIPSATNYRIRVTRNDFPATFDESDNPVSIVAPINAYYVNDTSFDPDDLTLAAGNDANSGLTASAPKASINAVLSAYVMKPGDIIYVDAGTYNLSTTLVLNAAASGIQLVGYGNPLYPNRATVINRGNTAANVIELQNADNVTFDRLTIRGGYNGINLASGSDSDNFTLSNSIITGNSNYGVLVDQTNDFARFLGNTFLSSGTNYSLGSLGTDAVISTNYFTGGFYDSGSVRGARSLVSNNVFNVVRNGLSLSNLSSVPADRIVLRDNTYTTVSENAIYVSSGNTLVTGNTIKRAGTGIYVGSTSEVRGNVVSDGTNGITAYSGATVVDNRIYNSSNIGLVLSNATNSGNRVYNNNIGIHLDFGSTGAVTNNFVYNNTSIGIQTNGAGYYGGTPSIINNTIIQNSGKAIYAYSSTTQNLNVTNNIIQLTGGYAIHVEPDASRGFVSDYNVINITGTGKLARWENIDFTSPVDWYYEVGLDQHSKFTDPQFINLGGSDGVLGFSDSIGTGLTANYYSNENFTGTPISQLVTSIGFNAGSGSPIAGIPVDNFSIRWEGYLYIPTAGTYTFYENADDGLRLYLGDVGQPLSSTATIDQWNYVNNTQQTGIKTFATSGWVPIRIDYHETVGGASMSFGWSGPGFGLQAIATRSLSPTLIATPTDYGADDSFAVTAGSAAIDAGDPNSPYYKEPSPNGGRINAGVSGNTTFAEVSAQQSIQIVSPNGLEKLEPGQSIPIGLRSQNLNSLTPTLRVNGDTSPIGVWANASEYATVPISRSFNNTVPNIVGLTDPAPSAVYQSVIYNSQSGVGSDLQLNLPVDEGTYTVRLHFFDPYVGNAASRRFDIRLNGTTVQTNYSIFEAAGNTNTRATIAQFSGIASTQGAIRISLLALTSTQAILSGVELLKVNPLGQFSPVAGLEYSADGGTNWSPIAGAAAVPLDRNGNGTFIWTIPTDQAAGSDYKIRATTTTAATLQLQDTSDAAFQISRAGNDYFVNDAVTTGDVFTTAVGNNSFDGKSSDQPMASLTSLLAAYNFGPGDVIHVDAGNYKLIKTAVLTAQESGVRIEGPSTGPAAILDRANTTYNVIELQNADNVTFDRLTIRGGYNGIILASGSDSDNFTLSNSIITGNSNYGVLVDQTNDFARFLGNTFLSSGTNYSLGSLGTDAVISTNYFTGGFYDSGSVRGARSLVSNNVFNVVRNGLSLSNLSSVPADRIVLRDNTYTTVSENAIYVSSGNTLVTGNTIKRAGTGIYVGSTSEIRGNVVSDGTNGITAYSGATVVDNRIYNSSNIGLVLSNATNSGNRVYNNNIGIHLDFGSTGAVTNNFVYNNTSIGIQTNGAGYYGGTPSIINNTIIQNSGKAIYAYSSTTQNLNVTNNIIQLTGGYAIHVEPDASRGFVSDYNVINITGTGKLARWENIDFTSPVDWYYEVGLDQHSKFTDPQFINLGGSDGVLGFSDSIGTGLTANYYSNENFTGTPISQLVTSIGFNAGSGSPIAGIPVDNFSIRWECYLYIPTAGTYTFYENADDGLRLYLGDVGQPLSSTATIDQWNYVNNTQQTGIKTFATSGWVPIRIDYHETVGGASMSFGWSGPGFGLQAIATRSLSPTLIATPTDYGADDSFAVAAGSAAIDAGDPNSPYYKEPSPNGGRINAGVSGNTTFAEVSAQQSIQIVSPSGLEKYELGQAIKIDFQSSNLLALEPVLRLNGGSNSLGKWVAGNVFIQNGTVQNYSNGTVDTSGVTNPAPTSLYGSQLYGSETLGDHLLINVPVGDGNYFVRLHFSEPFYATAGNRKFDIALNGVTKRLNYEIAVAAGGANKAVVEEYANIIASNSSGLTIDLTNRQGGFPRGPMVSAIEIYRENPLGSATPAVDLDVSSDNGATWTNIATNVPVDRFGSGSFNWTVPTNQVAGNNYKVRATHATNGTVSGQSYAPFAIANSGPDYYVSTTGDNSNSGKTPDQPVRSLSGLINSYDLALGDIIYVGAGSYRLYRNTNITSDDSGVTIRGSASLPTIFDRGNTNSGQRVFELLNADSITFDSLRITGGEVGLAALDGSDSDDFALMNSRVYGNVHSGVYVGSGNDRWTITQNKIYGIPGGVTTADDQTYGLFFNNASTGHRINANEIYDNSQYGVHIPVPLSDSVIFNNDVHGNRYGIYSQFGVGAGFIPLTIRDNMIRDNSDWGIFANSNGSLAIVVSGNQVFGQVGSGDVGMYIYNGTQATNNTVYGNYRGIVTSSYAPTHSVVSNNRVFNNSFAGIAADGTAQVQSNYVYSNTTGIALSAFTGTVSSNLVYANTNRGLLIQGSNGAQFYNNTLYQTVGDGIRIDSSSQNLRIYNNIVWVLAGYGLYVDPNSQTGHNIDYNLYYRGTAGVANIGFWGGANRTTLGDWRAASAKDVNSLEANAGFVDIDGADNTLGYDIVRQIDGGQDDNFYRTRNSPAIDRGSSWFSASSDIENFGRFDDPATVNSGGVDYTTATSTASMFGPAAVGVAQNWRADDGVWTLELPFSFSFYSVNYTSVNVSSNGLLQFGSATDAGNGVNSTASLTSGIRIAALWDDLRTDGSEDDVFVDTSKLNQVTIRWNATNKVDGGDVQFATTLFSDGRIQFDYGPGNSNLTPTVGTSAGDGSHVTISSYNGQSNLGNRTSLMQTPLPGPQWANSVIGFSSQYSTNGWSAAQAVGAPNTNSYGDISTAWAPSSANGTQEFITVGFAIPVYADGVTVRETYGNGFVTRIDVLDTTGIYHTVWTGIDPSATGAPVDFFISFAQTTYLVNGVKVFVNTNTRTTYEEIDAIRLHGVAAGVQNFGESNLGNLGFFSTNLPGTAKSWRSDDNYWSQAIGFNFPLYGVNYTSVNVSSNGLLQFNSTSPWPGDPANSTALLNSAIRIAPMWDDLRTDQTGDDIFVDTSLANQLTIRWAATVKATGMKANFAATLFADGRIRFDYGTGNAGLTPTVGISRGDGRYYQLAPGYDNATSLTNSNSVTFSLVPGIVDIGAYEFRGNSSDIQSPTVASLSPSAAVTATRPTEVRLTMSEELNPIDARSAAAYELRGAGPDNVFDTADDIIQPIVPRYTPGQNTTIIGLGGAATELLPGLYRLTAYGTLSTSLYDLAGNRFDGDNDGAPGGNYVRTFKVIDNAAPVLVGLNALSDIDENQFANPGTLVSSLVSNQIADADGPQRGLAIQSAVSPSGTWQYALDGVNFLPMVPTLTGGKVLLLAADADTRIRYVPNAGFSGIVNDLAVLAWDRADELPEGTSESLSSLRANSLSSASANTTINVVHQNSAPTDIGLSSVAVNENAAAGTSVGTLTAVDANPGDTFVYALVSGTGADDNALFTINGSSLKTNQAFDFETKSGYSIRVRASDQYGASIEKAITISVVDLTELGSIVIGDGTNQRSDVKQIVLRFDGPVDLQSGAFSLIQRGTNSVVTTTAAQTSLPGGQSQVVLTFSGALTRGGSALSDGYYQLTIDGSKIIRLGQSLDSNGDGVGGDQVVVGASETDNFFALYGDTNGDGLVGVAEFGQFRSTFGKTQSDPGYNSYFDYDKDGAVGVSDFGQFRSRFGKPKQPFQ